MNFTPRWALVIFMSFLPLFSSAEWIYDDGLYSFQEVRLEETKKIINLEKNKNVKHAIDIRKAMPNIQKALLVRNQLLSIVESYVASISTEKNFSQDKYVKLKEILLGTNWNIDSSVAGPYNVFFEFGQTRFQVAGIKQTRLAVNTGYSIIFNGQALASKDYTISELTQIWLHEIFHAEKETPLPEKDAWAAKVANWLSSQTQSITLSDGTKMTLVDLPGEETKKIVPWISNSIKDNNYRYNRIDFEQQFQELLQSRFLIFHETKDEVKLANEVYKAFRTYSDFIEGSFPTWNQLDQKVVWPSVKVLSVRKTSNSLLQFEYQQQSVPFQKYNDGTFQKDRPQYSFSTDTSSEPKIPQNRYIIEFNPQQNTTEIKRAYSVPLQEGDFETYRIHDIEGKRYVSIRLVMKNFADLLMNKKSIHLLAKDIDTKTNLSVALIKSRILDKGEVLLHFELPKRNLELGQILIPTTDQSGLYSELRLRPSRPQILHGSEPLKSSDFYVESIVVSEKINKHDQLLAQFKMKTHKRITAMTLELEHSVQAKRTRWTGSTPQRMKDDLGFFGIGRKYFFDKKHLRIKNVRDFSEVTIALLEEAISQWQARPLLDRGEWWPGLPKFSKPLKAETLIDSRNRKIINAWVHFEDGTNEKISPSKLPPRFSFVSKEEEKIRDIELQKEIDYRLNRDKLNNALPITSCKELFKN